MNRIMSFAWTLFRHGRPLAGGGVAVALFMLSACAQQPSIKREVGAEIPFPELKTPARSAGAIYAQQGFGSLLFGDVRARNVGDIITVELSEKTDATKKATTSTKKDNSIDIKNPTLFGQSLAFSAPWQGGQGANLGTGLDSSKSFDGEGASAQSNHLSGNISAVVIEVLPNGYLKIRGRKVISINRGDEYIELTGIVRPVDVRPDNTIPSKLIANARIRYAGSGMVADASQAGWLSEFFNSGWWPF